MRQPVRSTRLALVLVLATGALAGKPALAGHGEPHATIKYWNLLAESPGWYDPHETIEDVEGVTGHVATPQAPLTLVTSMENTNGGFCGPLYWNPVTNLFKTYPVTGGLQTAGDVNRTAPVVQNGPKTFQPGDAWFTVHGNSGYGVYVNFRNSDFFRRYEGLSGSFTGIRVNQATGTVYAAAFYDGAIFEIDVATNQARRWTIGNAPYWIDVDDQGRVYTAAAAGGGHPDQIVRVDPTTNEVRRWDIPGGGLATFVGFGMANGVRIDPSGDLWFSATAADKVGRLRVGANEFQMHGKAGLTGPEGIAASGAGATLQAFFTERTGQRISILTDAAAAPTVTAVAPAVSTETPAAMTPTVVDFEIAPILRTIQPDVFDSPGVDPSGILRFPLPPGVSGPAGISRVAEPSTIYGSFEGSDHLFRFESPAIIAPPGGCTDGPSISLSLTRPAAGRVYVNDADVGPSGSSAILVSGPTLGVEATSSNPANTQAVEFYVDGGLQGSDPTSPYAMSVNTALAPGAHTLLVRAAQVDTPVCIAVAAIPFVVPDPALKAVGKALTVLSNVPAEPQVHNEGARVGPGGGADFSRSVEQPLPPVITAANALTDRASGSLGSPFESEAESTIHDLDLLGGTITADVLHAKAAASVDLGTLTASAVDDGSVIAGLEIAGTPVTVSQPNTVVTIPGVGRVVLHETLASGSGTRAEITINMIHAFIDTPSFKGEVILGSAYAGVNFAQDFFTGPEADLIHRPDDAGSDTDAGASAATAVPIAPGVYSGALSPGDDSDFYSFETLQGERILAEMKPAEREVLTIGRVPTAPPAATIPGVTGFAFDTVGSVAAVGPSTPNFALFLYDPDGVLRASSDLLLSAPERVELNADKPYAPPGVRGTWTLEVRRAAGSVDGFYTLHLALPPEHLLDQNDAGPGDAPDSCAAARPITPAAPAPEEDLYGFAGVIRDADPADFFRFDAQIGQLITVELKPDELADGANFDLYLYRPVAPGGPSDCAVPAAASTLGAPPLPKGTPDAVVQLPATVTGTYTVEVRRINAVANYALAVQALNPLPTLPQNDAGTGTDAAGTCAGAAPLAQGAAQGRLGDVPAPDFEDWYRFPVAAGQDITATLKPSELSDFDLELWTGACALVPPDQLTLNHRPLSSPETVHLANAAAGDYRLRVVRVSGGGNYLITLTLSP